MGMACDWVFVGERVTGIEPALSAWEPSRRDGDSSLSWWGPVACCGLGRPPAAGPHGPYMARTSGRARALSRVRAAERGRQRSRSQGGIRRQGQVSNRQPADSQPLPARPLVPDHVAAQDNAVAAISGGARPTVSVAVSTAVGPRLPRAGVRSGAGDAVAGCVVARCGPTGPCMSQVNCLISLGGWVGCVRACSR